MTTETAKTNLFATTPKNQNLKTKTTIILHNRGPMGLFS